MQTQLQVRPRRLFDVAGHIEHPVGKALYSLVGTPFERLLSLETLNRLYAEHPMRDDEARGFFAAALEALAVDYAVDDADRAKIPQTGRVLVIANHPYGAIEGLVLGDLLTRRRTDVRILANYLLDAVTELQRWLIRVDPFNADGGAGKNTRALRAALRWLKDGGLLATFPAGAVSHLYLRRRQVVDPPWATGAAALARRTQATVVPVFFEGRNSALFQLAGLVHPLLRTALLPHELVKRGRSTVKLRIGRPIPPDKLAAFPDDAALTDYLRFKTYALAHREEEVRPRFRKARAKVAALPAVQAEIAPAVPPEILRAEIGRLDSAALLVEQGQFAVYAASRERIPAVVREIGRLRELTFRAVGEGTGRSTDLDGFDDGYLHLFTWNRESDELVGAYRLGIADRLLAAHGPSGLYTSTLFKFKPGFLERLGPSIELGRSFVRAEYQRRPLALALLWRGIGELLVRNPHYKTLFGPVSISRDYGNVSRRIMAEFLIRAAAGDASLRPLVKPKNPLRGKLTPEERQMLAHLKDDPDSLSDLVSDLEDDEKGMPVLLRHYLKLNARLYCFNVDPDFGQCLDGLIVLDLRTTAPRVLERFMGKSGYAYYASVA